VSKSEKKFGIGPDEHVRVDEVVVDHDKGLLQLGLRVENGVHLLAGVIIELHHLAQQVETALNGLLVPANIVLY